ncbi:MAG TPA: PAS domain-containing protein [Candidatus Limnocylindria bacterium]|nr:PAS domain-containing protein [Candidatus Limnocylindria bacterium]
MALTERQEQVLRLVAEGHENKVIAGRLGISEQAAKQQVSVLLRKFRAPSRTVLARMALALRLLGSETAVLDVPLEYLFERAPILIAMTRGPEHRFVLANRAFAATFGERPYAGRTVAEVFPLAPADLREGLDRIYVTGEGVRSNEQRLTLDDGARELYVSYVAEPTRDDEGRVDGVVLFATDVTEPVLMRRRLARLSEEQRILLEQMPVGVVFTDRGRLPVLVNRVAHRLLGWPIDPARAVSDQAQAWDPRFATTGLRVQPGEGPSARATAGWPFDDDLIVRRADGTDVVLRFSARPLHDEAGRITGAAIVFYEVPFGGPASGAAG